ncbi:metallophosphoesterase [Asticcacaulis sp. W401b]|uniref:metallophosphoesterase n=1 Tax=Asticcacaulis sp. W401b TaxID=3388666 RepID=UPI0039709905
MFRKIWSFIKNGELPEGLQSEGANSVIDMPTYAIGDIHGRSDLFEGLLAKILAEVKARGKPARLVCLGDYVDRGPSSNLVVERLVRLTQDEHLRQYWPEVIVLRGNHEATLLDFLNGAENGPSWMEYGGLSTLAAYGVAPPASRNDMEAWEVTRQNLERALPKAHKDLLERSELLFEAGDYLFVHAGVRPGQPLYAQGEETFLWIRGEFLSAHQACEKVVVHGHTPEETASVLPWRIGLDTGAYATGVLSAIYLEGTERRLVQVGL